LNGFYSYHWCREITRIGQSLNGCKISWWWIKDRKKDYWTIVTYSFTWIFCKKTNILNCYDWRAAWWSDNRRIIPFANLLLTSEKYTWKYGNLSFTWRMHSLPFCKLWNSFIRIHRQFWSKINARNGGTFDELYSPADNPDFQKTRFRFIFFFIVYTTKNLSIPLDRARRNRSLGKSCTYFFSRILIGNLNDRERVPKHECPFFKKKQNAFCTVLFHVYFSLGNRADVIRLVHVTLSHRYFFALIITLRWKVGESLVTSDICFEDFKTWPRS
jgi:hypothetical protein